MNQRKPVSLVVDFQNRHESLLGYFDRADGFHTLLAFLLLFEQLALTCDVAAVAFRQNVFALCLHGRAGKNAAAYGRLDRHFKHLAGNDLFQLASKDAAAIVSVVRVNDERQRINRFACKQDVEFDEFDGNPPFRSQATHNLS